MVENDKNSQSESLSNINITRDKKERQILSKQEYLKKIQNKNYHGGGGEGDPVGPRRRLWRRQN